MKDLIIAIDGLSSTGKSSLAKALSKRLGYNYIDSGAMFRAIAFGGVQNGSINLKDKTVEQSAFIKGLVGLSVSFERREGSGAWEVCLNGANVEKNIRSLEIGEMASKIAAMPEVRKKILELQHEMGRRKRIVMDGRDIGTVVFPDAELKLFLTASARTRAQRRFAELLAKGERITLEEVEKNLEGRDQRDETRDNAPVKQAEDAVRLDNTDLTIEQQVDIIERLIEEKFT